MLTSRSRLLLLVLPITCVLSVALPRDSSAQPAPSELVDAGALAPAGSDTSTAPTITTKGAGSDTTTIQTTTTAGPSGTTTSTAITMPDPTKDPVAFLASLKAMWSKSWGLALGFAVWGLLEGLAWAGAKWPGVSVLKWLGTGRVSVVLGTITGTLSTALAAASGAGGWTACFTAILAGAAAIWHPAGTAPETPEQLAAAAVKVELAKATALKS